MLAEYHHHSPMATGSNSPTSSSPEPDRTGTPPHRTKMDGHDTPASCGICLSEEGKASRGEIDSCDHYFCFVCVMEWAKVESRCPLCKRRFTRIRRPPKQGIFPFERVVNVPERTQVYHPMGIVSTGPYDPFAGVKCSVCNAMGEESLLILCDLCDMAVHTYCIGLGATVPEGDWLCHDCNTCKAEHVDIMDVVRSPLVVRLAKEGSSSSNQLLSPTSMNREINIASGNIRQVSSSVESNVNPSLRTLCHRRNFHNRIQALRENWNSLRNGTITFSSIFAETSAEGSGVRTNSMHKDRSDLPYSSSRKRRQQPTAQDHNSGISMSGNDSDAVRKAWRRMDIAKRTCNTASSAKKSLQPSSPIEKPDKAAFLKHRVNAHPLEIRDSTRPETRKQYNNHSDKKNTGRNSEKLEKQQQHHMSVKKVSDSSHVLSSTYLRGHCGLPNYRYPEAGNQSEAFGMICVQVSQKDIKGASSNISSEQHHSSSNPILPTVAESCSSFSGRESHISPPYSITFSKGRSEASIAQNRENMGDSKGEIQTLVKLNLKRLTKEKPLEVNAFKDVARRSTHSILAACGLEQLKFGVRSFPASKCSHTESNKSILMHDLCRKCFCEFVKNVVSSILFDKTGSRSS